MKLQIDIPILAWESKVELLKIIIDTMVAGYRQKLTDELDAEEGDGDFVFPIETIAKFNVALANVKKILAEYHLVDDADNELIKHIKIFTDSFKDILSCDRKDVIKLAFKEANSNLTADEYNFIYDTVVKYITHTKIKNILPGKEYTLVI